MENRYVGFLIIGIALVLVLIIFLFQTALKEIVLASCGLPHAVSCPMNETIFINVLNRYLKEFEIVT